MRHLSAVWSPSSNGDENDESISPLLLRMSIGLESHIDLLDDLQQAILHSHALMALPSLCVQSAIEVSPSFEWYWHARSPGISLHEPQRCVMAAYQ